MERAGAQALFDGLHEDLPFHDGTWRSWAKERSRSHPFHYMDGVRIVVMPSDINPDDHFTTSKNANPFPVKRGDSGGDKA